MIQWVQANIGKYKGNPDRMFIWAQSAGNGPLGTYIGRPEVWGPKGVGVKGAIFMSGQWNIAPLEVPGAGGRGPGAGANPLAVWVPPAAKVALTRSLDSSPAPAARILGRRKVLPVAAFNLPIPPPSWNARLFPNSRRRK